MLVKAVFGIALVAAIGTVRFLFRDTREVVESDEVIMTSWSVGESEYDLLEGWDPFLEE